MIELLILYILNHRDRTIYALRRDIIERFGIITKPSLGTIHPALKRLLSKGALNVEQKYSEGGKKSTYYSATQKCKEVFRELFFTDISDNPTIFHNQLSARLLTLSMLGVEEKKKFLSELKKRLELQRVEASNALNNKYVEYDEWQKAVISEVLCSAESLSNLAERLENLV